MPQAHPGPTPPVVGSPHARPEPAAGRRMAPATAVRLELARAVGGVALLPFRAIDFLTCNDALRKEFELDLQHAARVDDPPPAPVPTERPLRIFVSCAEASGELHATNLVRALKDELAEAGAPAPELVGLGGQRLAGEGVELIGEPVSRAAMGFDGMFAAVPYYTGLLRSAAEVFASRAPDLVLPVDSPALHVPLARIAKRYDLRVVHHVSPQFWAWAPWRARPYRRVVDKTLTILPFEPRWFARHGVRTAHVGHPLLDELVDVPAPGRARARGEPPPRVLALLPGSREQVIERNLPWMLRAVARLRRRVDGLEAVVVQQEPRFEARFRELVAEAGAGEWARIECGDLHGSLARCGAAFTVSGTILLDLLHHRLPTVVVYRVARRRDVWLYENLLSTPWFASVNLVLGRETLPEFCFRGEGPTGEIDAALVRCFVDRDWIRRTRDALERCAQRLGPPGASRRAARQALWTLP